MIGMEQTRNEYCPAQAVEVEGGQFRPRVARSTPRGVLVNQGSLPTHMMTRGRGVLLFYRGGLPTHLCPSRSLDRLSRAAVGRADHLAHVHPAAGQAGDAFPNRTEQRIEIALFHNLDKLPEPEFIPRFCQGCFSFASVPGESHSSSLAYDYSSARFVSEWRMAGQRVAKPSEHETWSVKVMAAEKLQAENEIYEREKAQLLAAEGAGKFVLIGGGAVQGAWEAYEDALKAGYERFGLEADFLVKKIESPVDGILFFSRDLHPCQV